MTSAVVILASTAAAHSDTTVSFFFISVKQAAAREIIDKDVSAKLFEKNVCLVYYCAQRVLSSF